MIKFIKNLDPFVQGVLTGSITLILSTVISIIICQWLLK